MQARLRLFGHYQLLVDGASAKFATEHSRALLAYLAVQPGMHERTTLATLLWPERPEATARQNLRQTLVNLKQTLQPYPQLEALLAITGKSIEVQAGGMLIDAQHFRHLWALCAAHTHSELAACHQCIARLQQAITLYTGEFLHGVYIKNSPLFDEWVLHMREEFHRQVLEILDTLTRHSEIMADYSQMYQSAKRQLALDPWREEAHRQVMRALALSEQRTAALAHYALCQRILDAELGVPPSAATTALYEQIKRGELVGRISGSAGWEVRGEKAVNRHQLRSLPPHNLPTPLTPFIGREQEVEEISHRLLSPEIRLLTLVGPGGMGKTRLAIEAAHKLYTLHSANLPTNPSFDDGLFFVSLVPLSSSDALAQAIAATLGLDLRNGARQTVIHYLHDKSLLLILDNFEHLLNSVSFIVELLERAPHVQILTTSRERLNVRGEQLYPVPPLIYLPQGNLAEATTWSAVRLFVECARRVMTDFKATETNLAALLRICGLVEGVPLGLEMAAVWCNALSLDEIADEIERNIDFLAVGYHDLPERQRSMRAVFAWSWRLLSEEEARVLRQLTLFSGSFTRQAAEAICDASPRVLDNLVNKSLLQRFLAPSEQPVTGTWRHELHILLRQFGQEQLRRVPDEWYQVTHRHSEFYLAFVAVRERRLMRHDPREAMSEIQTELDNVRQAWTWAAHNRAGAALDLAAYGLWQFYLVSGLAAEGVKAFQQAATALQGVLLDEPPDSTHRPQQPRQHGLGKLWALTAHLLSVYGNYDESIEAAQRAINFSTDGGRDAMARESAALGDLALGQALYHKNAFREATIHHGQALQAALAAQQELAADEIWPEIEVQARLFLGACARMRGDYVSAKRHLAECLQRCRQFGKLRSEVHAQLNLGYISLVLREQETARQAYEQVLSLTTTLIYRWGEGVARNELAVVVREMGEYSLSLALSQRALTIFVEIHERQKQVHTLTDLIVLCAFLGQFERAAAYQARQATLLQQIKAPDAERVALVASTILAYYQGNNEQAFLSAHKLWHLVHAAGGRYYQAEALTLLGQAQFALHEVNAAAHSYSQALGLFQALGVPAQAADAQAGLACIALAQGDHARARQLAEAVLSTVEQFPDAGLYEPFPLYLTCYHVLAATHDPRAGALLQKGYARLQSYAAHIHDESLRTSFLHNVPVHRQLIATYEAA